MTTDALLRVEAPCSLLNANHRRHWRVKARMVKAWRRAGKQAAANLGPLPTPVHVTVYVHRHANRGHYDAANYADTAKAVLDGIVDAGVLPDDRNAYVIGPDMRAGQAWPGGGVSVVLEPLSDSTIRAICPPTKDPLWNS